MSVMPLTAAVVAPAAPPEKAPVTTLPMVRAAAVALLFAVVIAIKSLFRSVMDVEVALSLSQSAFSFWFAAAAPFKAAALAWW